MADLAAGTLLGDRFEVLGAVGRGGSAVVYLALDRLRAERVALKVVHAHLTADPAVRRRLQREVHAAGVLRSDAALVPHDLHEIDGRLALTLPFHPGQTLAERVAATGPLPVEDVRALGVRVATALAEAHRAGVLHRDVTPNNILLSDASDAVLTDFGLARLQHVGPRSTGLLGTAGYAAPEVYSGERTDPRSDLYGLGAALYLAATGKPPFDVRDPMAALRQQLGDGFRPVRALRPEVPAALADTIEALLRCDPSARPQGARELLDRLEGRVQTEPSRPSRAEAGIVRQYLPPGDWTVVVRERDEDRGRRARLRMERQRGPATTEGELHRWGRYLVKNLRQALGIPESGAPTPEEILGHLVADEAGLPQDALLVPAVVYDKRFRLVDRTDAETARRLADGARATGFRAKAARVGPPRSWLDWLAMYFWLPMAVGWTMFPFASGLAMLLLPAAMAGIASVTLLSVMSMLSIALAVFASSRRGDPNAERLPVAWTAGLKRALTDGEHAPPRYAVGLTEAPPPAPAPGAAPEAPPSRGASLLARAEGALAALESTLEAAREDLPDVALRDLRATVSDLRRSARALAEQVDPLEAALGAEGAPAEALAMVQGRLDRLLTLERAGEGVDRAEIERLRAAIAQHEADLHAEEQVEARLAASTAQLLEIASTASRVRRELLAEAPARSVDDAVRRLREEVRAADAARREAGQRARAAAQQRVR